jgi:hypothetical protein
MLLWEESSQWTSSGGSGIEESEICSMITEIWRRDNGQYPDSGMDCEDISIPLRVLRQATWWMPVILKAEAYRDCTDRSAPEGLRKEIFRTRIRRNFV